MQLHLSRQARLTTLTCMATQIPHATRPSSNGNSPQQELFKTLVENMADPVFLIDLDTEQCVYVSPAIQALLGLNANELIGRRLTDFVHPDDRNKVVARSASRRRGKTPRTTVT